MTWILLLLLVAAALAAAVVAVRVARRTAHAERFGTDRPRRRCLRCRGTGWVGGAPERTFEFDGAGFADRPGRATPCPDCDGTGVR